MSTTPKPGQIALLAGGAVTLLFSFFAFVSYSGFGSDYTASAWSTDANLFPLATWPALFGVVIAGSTAASVFGNVKLPDNILGFTWAQVTFILAFAASVVMIGFLFANENKGIGFWFMFLGTIAYTAGSVLELLGVDSGAGSGQQSSTPPSPF